MEIIGCKQCRYSTTIGCQLLLKANKVQKESIMNEALFNAACDIIDDFEQYGDVFQTDDDEEYGETTAIAKLRRAVADISGKNK